MIACVYAGLLLVNSLLASNDAYFTKGWTPVSRSFVFNQKSNRHYETSHNSDWKPSQNIDNIDNIDLVKENAVQIIAPDQTQTLPNEKNANAWPPSAEAAVVPTPNDNSDERVSDSQYSGTTLMRKKAIDNSAPTEINQDIDQRLVKPKSIDKMQKGNVLVKTDINRRAPKHIWDLISTKDIYPFNFRITSEPDIKTNESNNSINYRNITYTNYEVIEPANDQDLRQEMNDLRNNYTNKFVRRLSNYNIKDDDQLDNYARSKVRHKKLYPPNLSSVSLIPFRYNSLDHLPVNPLLAVLLSNYGYYLHGFYGLQNNYKNLYGYSASNNIHNNKPFGSYKIYSDTDSSN